MFTGNVHIALNSKKQVFLFQLTPDEEVICSLYNSSLVFLSSHAIDDNEILNYSLVIDKNDFIHLIVLRKNGDLNYHTYVQGQWSKYRVTSFDLTSNLYKQIEILKEGDKIHILYSFTNLINSNIWTIQHVILSSKERYNVVKYLHKKIPQPFALAINKQGALHLLYGNIIDSNLQICHSFFNPFASSWLQSPNLLSKENTSNVHPFLFIDSQDNLHGLWIEKTSNRKQLSYMKMNSAGREKYKWKEVLLPAMDLAEFPPLIVEENRLLKLFLLSLDSLLVFTSDDYGDSWVNDKEESLKHDLTLAKVTSNLDEQENRINYGYCSLQPHLKFYFFQEDFPGLFLDNLSQIEDIPALHGEDLEKDMVEEADPLGELREKLDLIRENQDSIRISIKAIIDSQDSLRAELDQVKMRLDNKKDSLFSRFFS